MTKTSSKAKVGDTIASISTETLNERILRQCHEFYTDPEKGLVEIGKRVDLSLLAPRKKIIVLLIGNHSAGKSSYINWYIEEHILKTGVAMETQGVTFVTSGKKRETFSGNATLHLYSHFEPLREINGVVDYLSTEVSTSKQKKFSLVTFIDTPGLVDGNMKYPFDINEAILWLGTHADLIFVFYEPMGQALCKRTLDLVEELAIKNGDRMKFYLSKADEAGNEADRQRVMMQIVQEICKKPLLNKTSFDMPTIYIPNPNVKVRCLNQIEETSKEIERTINHTIQNTLNTLEDDCKKIATKIDTMLIEDQIRRETNWSIWVSSSVMFMISLALPLLVFMCLTSSFLVGGQLAPFLPKDMLHAVEPYAEPFSSLWSAMKLSFRNFLIIIFGSIFLFFFSKFYSRRHTQPTMTKKQKQQLLENKNYVIDYIKGKKDSMYKEYLRDYIADNEM